MTDDITNDGYSNRDLDAEIARAQEAIHAADGPEPVIVTETEPAIMSPATRWLRTLVQVVLALGAAIPSAVALLDLPATTAAKVSAYAGALVLLVSAAHNAVNSRQAKH